MDFPLALAYPLAGAWCSELATHLQVRALVIKGPVLAEYRLRTPRIAADVDVLVHPDDFESYTMAVAASGWTERHHLFIADRTAPHSTTFIRDGWPIDIDVHRFFPGFLADPGLVFDILWARRVPRTSGHVRTWVPDRPSSALILGLHSTGGAASQQRHARELDELKGAKFSKAELVALVGLATETGAYGTLGGTLAELGAVPATSLATNSTRDLRDWNARVEAGSEGPIFWLQELRDSRLRRKPLVLLRAVWPTRADLVAARPETVDTFLGRLVARSSRLRRGLVALPNAVFANSRQRSANRSHLP